MSKPEVKHTPTPWNKEGRTPEEVAYFAGPNKDYVLRAVNSHEALLEAAKRVVRMHKQGFLTTPDVNDLDKAITHAEGGNNHEYL